MLPHADHLFTTRHWAIGHRHDVSGADDGWGAVAAALGEAPDRLVRLKQVHGAAHVVAREARGNRPEADIVLTDRPDLVISVQAADCVPLLLADRRRGAVAAAHAGWRGLSVNAPGKAVAALASAFGTDAADLVAVVGPSIGACCYEVGADVRDAFATAGYEDGWLGRWFSATPLSLPENPSMPGVAVTGREQHWFFDGWATVRDQLVEAGVDPGSIHVARLCTASHPDWFCSYRRDKQTGRLAGAIRRRTRP
jgi:YfiH family protein